MVSLSLAESLGGRFGNGSAAAKPVTRTILFGLTAYLTSKRRAVLARSVVKSQGSGALGAGDVTSAVWPSM